MIVIAYLASVFIGVIAVSIAVGFAYPNPSDGVFLTALKTMGTFPFAYVVTLVPAVLARLCAKLTLGDSPGSAIGFGALVGLFMMGLTAGFFQPIVMQEPNDFQGLMMAIGYIGGGSVSGFVWWVIEGLDNPDFRRSDR